MYRKYFYQSDTITSNIAPKLPLGKCQKCNPMFEADKKKNQNTDSQRSYTNIKEMPKASSKFILKHQNK